MRSETVNLTLSLTLQRGGEDNAVPLVARCLTELVAVLPDLISGTLSVYGDEYLAEDDKDIEISVREPVDARTLGRLADVAEESS